MFCHCRCRRHCSVCLQNDDDYLEPIDHVHHAADVADRRQCNDDANQPQYAEVWSVRRTDHRQEPVPRRPYADDAQYASIDHRITGHTFLVVCDDPPV